MNFGNIEILEKEPNKKGDLFGRLMGDLFHSIGYDKPRLNIHKSGREIDLQTKHRTENKIAIAECKAHLEKTGGDDINKFIGAFDAEQRKIFRDHGFETVAYFISLSGFKETAIEQENEFDNKRVILIRPEKIIGELINGRIIVSIERAISSISELNCNLSLAENADLLAYQKGWVWALYYSDSSGQAISHYSLVHAEGKPLIKELAEEIIELDRQNHNLFAGLKYTPPDNKSVLTLEKSQIAQDKYYKYLETELGEIQFEGISATDQKAVETRVKLENIFVPLHLLKIENNPPVEQQEKLRKSVGQILTEETRLAILAKPGAGKSTLIKRIAISYAFPNRRKEINDNLPDKSWFPIFLRCRELAEKVTYSITDIINNIPVRAEIPDCINEFSFLVSHALQNGNALLLIDGLDEIVEDKNRIAFANQLRTFIATYPTIRMIVTSREAGFRAVGGALAGHCEHFKVAGLIESEIEELSIKWHVAIIDNTQNTTREAKKISDIIIGDERIRALAENPLLLTTLLFVKRWAGYLPTKRSVLYQEMIKLLLVTWNIEGHEQLDIDEAEPQLAYVAFWMTKNKQQTITEDELTSCLIDARKQLPEILGFTNISPSEFIKRVEVRSSLLIMSGHKRLESGHIIQLYEFLHLSFQEYLTAKAVVKGYIPHDESHKTKLEVLIPHFASENWKEVIPLVAVLLERSAKDLIAYIINEIKSTIIEDERAFEDVDNLLPSLLGNCLVNEVQITPELSEEAIEWFLKTRFSGRYVETPFVILKNKFGLTFRRKINQLFFENYDDKFAFQIGSVIGEIFLFDLDTKNNVIIFNKILAALKNGTKQDKCTAILGLMVAAFSFQGLEPDLFNPIIDIFEVFDLLYTLLLENDPHFQFTISWSIAWSENAGIFPNGLRNKYADYLVNLWVETKDHNKKRAASWALRKILRPSLSKDRIIKIKDIKIKVEESFKYPENDSDELTAIYLGYIIGIEWDRIAVVKLFMDKERHFSRRQDKSFYSFAKVYGVKLNG